MEIGYYIADLLRNQDEVSLPGLGTFTKERVAGMYDPESNSFNPPTFQVSFTDRLTNFNFLSEYISNKKNLSPSSAEYFVNKFASGLVDVLQTSGIAEVRPLGFLHQKSENLTFEPSSGFDVSGKFYGLKPVVELRPLALTPVINDSVIIPDRPGGSIEDFITSEGYEEIEEEEYPVEEGKSKRTLLTVLSALLFAVIAAFLLYFFHPGIKDLVNSVLSGYVSSAPATPAPENIENTLPPETPDSSEAVLTPIVQDSVPKDSISKSDSVESEERAAITTPTIEIIGAAFGRRSEAEAYVAVMKKKGLEARILEDMPGPLFKVSLASFPDLQSARQELSRIKKEVEKEAWPTTYKPKKTR
jgi:nucleoid DNA-binding protein